eukprot:gene5490-9308_t
MQNETEKACSNLNSLTQEYYGECIKIIETPISNLKFHQEFVSQNKPCIIKNGAKNWKALKQWNYEYLKKKLNQKVIVDVTPFGNADALVEHKKKFYFTQPKKLEMDFGKFVEEKLLKKTKNVYYLQHQNDNFRSNSFQNIWNDIKIPSWANEVFQNEPDAINIWIGEKRSITSVHKDHYENIYTVIKGKKHFTLYPPTNLPYLYQKFYPQAQYEMNEDEEFDVKVMDEESEVPWISVDPKNPDFEKFPNFKLATPYCVTLEPGDMLYLPSLWFHQVEQSVDENGEMIAVNFWYDMEYGPLYNYFSFVENLNLKK